MEQSTLSSSSGQYLVNRLVEKPIVMQILRFVAIGLLNTGLSFVVANLVSKYFGVEQGNQLGLSSGAGFIVATLQSYSWNKSWAFGQQQAGLMQNFLRLVWVGLVGVVTLGLVYLGSQHLAPYFYYLILLVLFFAAQYALWKAFGLSTSGSGGNPFVGFFIVSFIGFLINFFIAARFSEIVHLTKNGDLNKNIALVAATAVSLVWNFIGYKVIVFKK